MSKRDNFFKKFINCIYNLKSLVMYPKYGIGKAILYVFIMTAIFGTLRGLIIGYNTNKELSDLSTTLQSEEYKFNIENGILNLEKSPLKVESTSTLIYIDGDKNLNEINELREIVIHNDNNILFLKDGICIQTGEYKQQAYYKDLLGNNKLDNKTLYEQSSYIKKMVLAILIMYTIFFTFINLLINCLFVTAFASVVLIIMKVFMKYSVLYSLSLYVSTLPFIFQTILQIVFPTNIKLDTMFIAGTLAYMIFILKYIKDEMIKNKLNKGKL